MFILMVGNILQTVSDNLDKGRKMLEEVMARSTWQENEHHLGLKKLELEKKGSKHE